ncbi:hypothetical protein ACJZ2D_004402 [Fusarium nematophilum]
MKSLHPLQFFIHLTRYDNTDIPSLRAAPPTVAQGSPAASSVALAPPPPIAEFADSPVWPPQAPPHLQESEPDALSTQVGPPVQVRQVRKVFISRSKLCFRRRRLGQHPVGNLIRQRLQALLV